LKSLKDFFGNELNKLKSENSKLPAFSDALMEGRIMAMELNKAENSVILRVVFDAFVDYPQILSVTGALKAALGPEAKIILVMPNTPILVGEGATAMSRCEPTTAQEFQFAMELFQGGGVVREVPRDRMNEVIAVNGSTPAYIYLLAKYFCEYAQAQGIDGEAANALFSQTLVGAAAMMTQTGKTHQELIDMVTSPGGTTLAGLEALKAAGLEQTIRDCCDATIRRAYQLGH